MEKRLICTRSATTGTKEIDKILRCICLVQEMNSCCLDSLYLLPLDPFGDRYCRLKFLKCLVLVLYKLPENLERFLCLQCRFVTVDDIAGSAGGSDAYNVPPS